MGQWCNQVTLGLLGGYKINLRAAAGEGTALLPVYPLPLPPPKASLPLPCTGTLSNGGDNALQLSTSVTPESDLAGQIQGI